VYKFFIFCMYLFKSFCVAKDNKKNNVGTIIT